ncbi:MAG: phosphopantetheine-binding protein [Acutalibacteraceae bacterium]|nr:phosphopantetheine-binding protein [Acutalibacteraceae bacterium]HIR03407.1 acyl carrier protein [Candidatus Scatovicinus merdipullorum]
MNQEQIQEKLKAILKDMLNLDQTILDGLAPDTDLIEKLTLSSIDAIELIVIVERDFGISIDDVDIGKELVQTLETLSSKIMEVSS